jgi:GDPmannose 4,6-dehydratase
MNAIIFGSDGQDGQYLSTILNEKGFNVTGISPATAASTADLKDAASVERFIEEKKPDLVFHLAAFSSTRHDLLFQNHEVITTGTINLLEAVKNKSPHTKVFISGSGLQFQNNELAIKETDPFEARDAYSMSRIQSVYAARYYRSLGLKVYVGYFFNHDSPFRTEAHMTKKISEAAKRIRNGREEKIEIGDMDAIKEYGFAGDIVKAVMTLVSQDEIMEATIGTGEGYSIKDWLMACFALTGKDWKDYVVEKPGFVSPYKQLVSDPSTIFSLGWKPEVSFEQLAELMMR